jgi:hypothetical protein
VYGIAPSEIYERMPLAMVESYLDQIPKILAERKFQAGLAASLPHMKEPTDTMQDWIEEAFGSEQTKTIATPAMLKLIGIGVKYVGKSG